MRLGIEQDVTDADRADAIDHRVMGLGRKHPAAILEPIDKRHLPQGGRGRTGATRSPRATRAARCTRLVARIARFDGGADGATFLAYFLPRAGQEPAIEFPTSD
jgi:hypothetical protein